MRQLEIWATINEAVRDALLDDMQLLSQGELLRRADELLATLPTTDGGQAPSAALLLRRYRVPLQRELCIGREPRPLPEVVEDEVRELTRAVMVAAGVPEGFSVDAAVLLALAIRAGGLARFCALPMH
jgi:hypothetical protein